MRILEIFTGGTIGSAMKDGYITASEENLARLLDKYKAMPGSRSDIEIDTCCPYTILSENLSGEHLNMLADCIRENIGRDYCGIIITHGTDTLQYTAAALSIILENAPIPVLLVSSNYILDDPRANGAVNFFNAIRYIADGGNPGVYVSYDNSFTGNNIQPASDMSACILPADSLLPHAPYSDRIEYLTGARTKCGNGLFYNAVFSEHSPILYVRALPGQMYPDIPKWARAVLLDSYHSGTVCTTLSTSNFCKKAKALGIPVYLIGSDISVCYESTRYFNELDIYVLPKASPIYIYMKLWLILANNLDLELLKATREA